MSIAMDLSHRLTTTTIEREREREREREDNLVLVGPMKLCLFKRKCHDIHFQENENAQQLYVVFLILKMKTRYKKTTKHCHLWWISQKLKKKKTENTTFFLKPNTL